MGQNLASTGISGSLLATGIPAADLFASRGCLDSNVCVRTIQAPFILGASLSRAAGLLSSEKLTKSVLDDIHTKIQFMESGYGKCFAVELTCARGGNVAHRSVALAVISSSVALGNSRCTVRRTIGSREYRSASSTLPRFKFF
jgi:hypothetical protein